MVQELLAQKHIDVNIMESGGRTALMYALERAYGNANKDSYTDNERDQLLVRQLLKHPGLQINLQMDLVDMREFCLSITEQKIEDVKNVEKSAKIDRRGSILNGGLKMSMRVDSLWNTIRSKKVDIRKMAVRDRVAATFAAIGQQKKKLKKQFQWWTVLTYASAHGWHDAVEKILLHPDVDINQANSEGSTALQYSIAYGHPKISSQLLAHPAIDVNTVNIRMCSALHFAACLGAEAFPSKHHNKTLLQYGAEVFVTN